MQAASSSTTTTTTTTNKTRKLSAGGAGHGPNMISSMSMTSATKTTTTTTTNNGRKAATAAGTATAAGAGAPSTGRGKTVGKTGNAASGDPNAEIAELSKKINEHADAMYHTWKRCGVPPDQLLEIYTSAAAATAATAGVGEELIAAATAGDGEGLQQLVNSFVIKDKEQRSKGNVKKKTGIQSPAATSTASPKSPTASATAALQSPKKVAAAAAAAATTTPTTTPTLASRKTLPDVQHSNYDINVQLDVNNLSQQQTQNLLKISELLQQKEISTKKRQSGASSAVGGKANATTNATNSVGSSKSKIGEQAATTATATSKKHSKSNNLNASNTIVNENANANANANVSSVSPSVDVLDGVDEAVGNAVLVVKSLTDKNRETTLATATRTKLTAASNSNSNSNNSGSGGGTVSSKLVKTKESSEQKPAKEKQSSSSSSSTARKTAVARNNTDNSSSNIVASRTQTVATTTTATGTKTTNVTTAAVAAATTTTTTATAKATTVTTATSAGMTATTAAAMPTLNKVKPTSGARAALTNGQDKNLGRPILTRGSVAERVLMFEKCPDVRNSFLNIKRPDPADAPPKSLLKVKLHSTPPPPPEQNLLQKEIRSTKSVYIPRFYFPHGKPQPTIAMERVLRGILSAFDSFPNNQVTKDELPRILKLCGLPFYWRMPVMVFCQTASSGLVERQRFVEFWKQMNVYCHDAASRFVYILSRGQRFRSHIVPDDLVPLVQDVVDTHPGLAFLKEATEFHSRYVHTVIARIFYSVNRSWSGKISISELKHSDLLEMISLLEEEEDINQIMAFFSYEHFYVIYCKFWELDKDHDLLINQEDLARHSDHALSDRIVQRIFSGCVTRSDNKKSPEDEPRMSYTDFVWFILSEEDKRTPTAIEYWFRCMDINGDGLLSMYELEYFYEDQQQRMESIGIECLPFEDCLCQMLDMIKPVSRDCITLGDLKRCKMTHVFFDTFFNLEKYLDHEQRDPFASQRDEYSSDWDRFAAQEYELLITEENE